MIDLFSYDPAVVAGTWEGPALIVQGDANRQVRALDAELLGGALPQARRVDLPGGTHLLKADVEGRPFATYTDRALPLHEDLLPGIVGFLADTTGPD